MRADRLLSLLMLLQSRGRQTARALAAALEVSERTIYRDIEALSAAGVPVYAERGPGGGCSLLDSYRTSLTGLTEAEARALFMVSIPAPLSKLGVSQELKSALLKLSAALPPARRSAEAGARQRIHLDSTWWFQPEEPLPHLQTLYEAAWQDRAVQLTYRLRFGTFIDTQLEWLVEPYGLVAKASVWYLVCAREGQVRAYRVSQVLAARLTDSTFERPPGFDLAAFWKTWCADFERSRPELTATVRVAPEFLPALSEHFGEAVRAQLARAGDPGPGGRLTVNLPFESLEEARSRILGWGRGVEVVAPSALRQSVIDFAGQTLSAYGVAFAKPVST